MHSYIKYVNPELGKLLTKIGLDKQYQKGEGCYLYDNNGRRYLDFIAAYGALPFGFNPPEIWQAINQVQIDLEPSFAQPSLLEAAGELARLLVSIAPAGLEKVTFTNSGAEAVEAAVKLARAKTGRMGIIAADNSFHGKTLGALSATGNAEYQKAFGAPVEGFHFVPYGDISALYQLLQTEAKTTAAVILEPIQGEGGIVEPPAGYLGQVRAICTELDILLIFDEIQTGLGRTGRMFACESEQVIPDIITLAKALGGGLIPIGAVLCSDEVYTEEFGLKHSSTFAANTIACRVGLKVLELLTENAQWLIKEVARKGNILKQGLLDIQSKYPQIIREVRGRGLMLGIDFGSARNSYPDSMLGIMAEQKLLTPIIASYLLNVEQLRVAPTLNGASVIRIEPSLTIGDEQIQFGLKAIENAAALLARRNTAALFGHLLSVNVQPEVQIKQVKRPKVLPSSEQQEGRFAFLLHPLDAASYSDFDSSLNAFTHEQLSDLTNRWSEMVEPFVISGTRITGKTGKIAYGEFIVIPYTAKELQNMSPAKVKAEILEGIDIAVARGAKIVGLGAYTSVVTQGGRSLLKYVNVPITTGNSFTVTSGVDALIRSGQKLGLELNRATAAVVGAGGAIGKASALLLADKVANLILIGNPNRVEKSNYRMLKVMAEMYRYLTEKGNNGQVFSTGTVGAYVNNLTNRPKVTDSLTEWIDFAKQDLLSSTCPVKITVDIKKNLPDAHIILAATSSTDVLITSDILRKGALICDLSRPSNVCKAIPEKRSDVLVIDGGIIEVPGRPDLGWNFGFEKGLAYACMSETMMLALEQHYENTSIGADLNIDYLNRLKTYAAVHGFRLAGFRSFDSPLSESTWNRVAEARNHALIAENKF